jgi:hypothetical protein
MSVGEVRDLTRWADEMRAEIGDVDSMSVPALAQLRRRHEAKTGAARAADLVGLYKWVRRLFDAEVAPSSDSRDAAFAAKVLRAWKAGEHLHGGDYILDVKAQRKRGKHKAAVFIAARLEGVSAGTVDAAIRKAR